MNFKVPSIASAIVFLLIFLINLIKGNHFGIVMLRSMVSAGITFAMFFAMMFVFKTVLGVSDDDWNESEPESDDDGTGHNFDATVGDDEAETPNITDTVIDTNDYSDSGSDDADISNDTPDYTPPGDDFLPMDEHSDYDQGFADVGTSDTPGNLSGETLREKLGYDATAEDLAKAIRTIMPRDDK